MNNYNINMDNLEDKLKRCNGCFDDNDLMNLEYRFNALADASNIHAIRNHLGVVNYLRNEDLSQDGKCMYCDVYADLTSTYTKLVKDKYGAT